MKVQTYKNFRLNASQNQHAKYHYIHSQCIKNKQGNYDKHFISQEYHYHVFNKQKKLNRILTKDEKKSVYNFVVSSFY